MDKAGEHLLQQLHIYDVPCNWNSVG